MDEALNLRGAKVALNAIETAAVDLSIQAGRFYFEHVDGGRTLDLSGFVLLPGLINAHDHLDLNLFPRLGKGPYPNARLWAEDIYRPHEAPAKQHLSVPKSVRLLWGGIKNLLSGVTTVAHHNPYIASTFESKFPVRVLKQYAYAHSLTFATDWKQQSEQTRGHIPFIIHAAEGSDEESRAELQTLDAAGALRANTVIVHGVALDAKDAGLLLARNASLIWCPSSNLFTLGRTLSPALLESGIPIALATDSALTAAGDLLDELRTASQFAGPERLYEMVTSLPARILRLPPGAGRIQQGSPADLLIIRDTGGTPAEMLLSVYPDAVFADGELRLISTSLAKRLCIQATEQFERITVDGRGTWLLPFPVADLVSATKRALGESPTLAGKAVAA